jgi:hypothetical protein
MPKQAARGGWRENAGRKPGPGGTKRPVTLWLSAAERDHLAAVGGTAQGGLRRLVAASMGGR